MWRQRVIIFFRSSCRTGTPCDASVWGTCPSAWRRITFNHTMLATEIFLMSHDISWEKARSLQSYVTQVNWSKLARFSFWRTDQTGKARLLVIGWRVWKR